jgi:NAD(P)-dependent dehydrogenase (short-subunit alcohol dehydrogenase family)
LVKGSGRRALATKADVRELDQLRAAAEAEMAEFGHLDIVVANAGICPLALGDPQPTDFVVSR